MTTPEPRWRVGFDIGGTFTDFVLYDGQNASVTLHKRLTTPHDPSEAALKGLEELLALQNISHADVSEIVHGTTLVTNAVIERKGAPVGLITTSGFRDILEMGTEQRYDIYDLFVAFPDPLVRRDLRLEVAERVTAAGEIITPLDEDAVRAAAQKLVAQGCEAVAIVFLHSYANPEHERRAAEIVRQEFPAIAISISSDVVAEMGEYQRSVTTCANAFVQPLMHRYLTKLEQALHKEGFSGPLRLMHSAGGLVSLETARDFPIRLLESGPAGGGLATALFAEGAGLSDVISFDMGGTTAKACMMRTWFSATTTPGSSWAAACNWTSARPAPQSRAWPNRWAWALRKRHSAFTRSWSKAWHRRHGCTWSSGARIRATIQWLALAAQARPMRSMWRAPWASALF